jgi:hypothetical protein
MAGAFPPFGQPSQQQAQQGFLSQLGGGFGSFHRALLSDQLQAGIGQGQLGASPVQHNGEVSKWRKWGNPTHPTSRFINELREEIDEWIKL